MAQQSWLVGVLFVSLFQALSEVFRYLCQADVVEPLHNGVRLFQYVGVWRKRFGHMTETR